MNPEKSDEDTKLHMINISDKVNNPDDLRGFLNI